MNNEGKWYLHYSLIYHKNVYWVERNGLPCDLNPFWMRMLCLRYFYINFYKKQTNTTDLKCNSQYWNLISRCSVEKVSYLPFMSVRILKNIFLQSPSSGKYFSPWASGKQPIYTHCILKNYSWQMMQIMQSVTSLMCKTKNSNCNISSTKHFNTKA